MSRTPVLRMLRSNWLGVLLQVATTGAVAAGSYVAVPWNTTENIKQLGLSVATGQYMTIVALAFNALGCVVSGHLLDSGVPALTMFLAVLVAVVGLAFAVFAGAMRSTLAAGYIVLSLLLLVLGVGQTIITLPMTRIYAPLDRSTGHSLAYNIGYGFIGGLAPLVVTALQAAMPQQYKSLAPAFWIMAMAVPGFAAALALCRYRPRLNQPYVARLA